MRPLEPTDRHAWLDDRVEAYLDGALTPAEAEAFDRALAEEDDWEGELFLATQVRDGLRALPLPPCPPAATRAVFVEVRRQARADRLRAWVARWWAPLWQPSLAMALLVAVVLAATLVGRAPQQAPPAVTAEVEAALAEAKWTLAYLSQLGRQTGRSVRHEVLENHVVEPVQEALGTVLPETPKTQN